jgi:GT2 family glycosyltransferase
MSKAVGVDGEDEPTYDGNVVVQRYGLVEMIIKNRLGVPSSAVVRRDDLVAVGLFDERIKLIEDYDLWLRLVSRGVVARIEPVLGRYRIHADAQGQRDRRRTHRGDVQFVRSLRERYAYQPGIARLVRRSLSVRFLELAIERCDEAGEYGFALIKTIQSFLYWPWSDPHGRGRRLIRLRRARRILMEMVKARLSRGGRGQG